MEALAEQHNQPVIQGGLPLFEWQSRVPILDVINDNYNGDDEPEEVQGAEVQGADAQEAGVEPKSEVQDQESTGDEDSEVNADSEDKNNKMEKEPVQEEEARAIASDGEDEDKTDKSGVYSHAQQLAYAYEQQMESHEEIVFKKKISMEGLVETVVEEADEEPPNKVDKTPAQQTQTRYALRPNREQN